MEKVLLYDSAQIELDAVAVEEALRSISDVTNVRTSPKVIAAVEADYDGPGGQAIVRLISSRNAIAIEGDFDAIVQVAWGLQQRLKPRLHVIDESYEWEIALYEASTVDQLRTMLLNPKVIDDEEEE